MAKWRFKKGIEKLDRFELKKLKYEIARDLGLIERINNTGWKGLSARECGRIGGKISSRRKKKRNS